MAPCHTAISVHGGYLAGRYYIVAFFNFERPAVRLFPRFLFIIDVLLAERCHAFLDLRI